MPSQYSLKNVICPSFKNNEIDKTYVFTDFLGVVGQISLGKRIGRVALKVAGITDQVNTALA